MQTIQELQQELKKPGTLSSLLLPDAFAPEDALADKLARRFEGNLKPNQTRRIFHTFKQLEQQHSQDADGVRLRDEDTMRLTLLIPELAYGVGRGLIPDEFYQALKACLQSGKIQTVADLRRLVQFLSAVVAYQKYHAKK